MVSPRYSDFAICSCGGISQICQWYRACDAGALRTEPLATLYILRGQYEVLKKTSGGVSERGGGVFFLSFEVAEETSETRLQRQSGDARKASKRLNQTKGSP